MVSNVAPTHEERVRFLHAALREIRVQLLSGDTVRRAAPKSLEKRRPPLKVGATWTGNQPLLLGSLA